MRPLCPPGAATDQYDSFFRVRIIRQAIRDRRATKIITPHREDAGITEAGADGSPLSTITPFPPSRSSSPRWPSMKCRITISPAISAPVPPLLVFPDGARVADALISKK